MNLLLSKLNLLNFATFEDQTINFENNFNAIIGETGSGKSLILEAIQLILGSRADKKIIRKNTEFSIIEATFISNSQYIRDHFNSIGFPYDHDEITIKRILYVNGKSKSFLNHQSCSLNTLIDFSRKFIDIVGQFENQKLLSDTYQLALLDHYANTNDLNIKFQNAFQAVMDKLSELEQKKKNYSEYLQKQDYVNFQIQELESINPSVERENSLLAEKKKIQSLQSKQDLLAKFNFLFEGDESASGVFDLISRAKKLLNSEFIDDSIYQLFQQTEESLNELVYKLNSENSVEDSDIDFDSIINELDQYTKLRRKFNCSTEDLAALLIEFNSQKEEIDNFELNLEKLENDVLLLKKQAFDLALELHQTRKTFAKNLSDEITTQIRSLKMIGATALIKLEESKELSKNGITKISFQAETNPGEGFHIIKEIASGGELSRILLALRTILSSKDSISIFLFDEIDTGIGGETAYSVGNALKLVAKDSQVIAITHLPQIAYFAKKLIKVSKNIIDKDDNERTISSINEIMGDELKKEVESMSQIH